MQQLKELASTFGPASLIYIFKSLCFMMLQVSQSATLLFEEASVLLKGCAGVQGMCSRAPGMQGSHATCMCLVLNHWLPAEGQHLFLSKDSICLSMPAKMLSCK